MSVTVQGLGLHVRKTNIRPPRHQIQSPPSNTSEMELSLCKTILAAIVNAMTTFDCLTRRHRLLMLLPLVAAFALCVAATASWAQDRSAVPVETEDSEAQVFHAPVIIDGARLFLVRGTHALPATERAEVVQDNIIAAAEADATNFVKMDIAPNDFGLSITANGRDILTVTEADAELEELAIEIVAEIFADQVSEAILTYRSERTEEAYVSGALDGLAWTFAFALFTALILWIRKRLASWIKKTVHKNFQSVETATNDQVQSDAIAALIGFGVQFVLLITFFLGLYYFLSLVMLSFAQTRPFAQLLLTYVTDPILSILLGFIAYLPNLITLAIIALLVRYIIKGLRVFFDAVETGSISLGEFEPHWIGPTFNIARAVVIMIAVVFSFPYIPGSDSAAFQGLTILVGAMLSLGSNSVVGNVLSGLFVIYRRSTNIGDRIKIGEHVGDVVQIKLMETHMKSIKNELISIPNAQMLNSEVVNYSRKIDGSGLLLHTTVGIGYEEAPERIEAMLIEAAHRTEGLKKRPEPFVLWTALADYAINYQVNAYSTRGSHIPRIMSDLHRNIVAVFNENRVQIMTPSYIADPDEPKISTEPWDGTLSHEG